MRSIRPFGRRSRRQALTHHFPRRAPTHALLPIAVAAIAATYWALPRHTPHLLRWMSEISYSFYLCHGLALNSIARLALPFVYATALALVTAVVLSAVVYYAIERPTSPLSQPPTRNLAVGIPAEVSVAADH